MKSNSFIIVAIIVFVLNLTLIGGYWFLFNTIKTINENTSSVVQAIEDEQRRVKQAIALHDIVEETTNERSILSKRLVDKDGVVGLIESLEAIAHNLGLELAVQSITVTPDALATQENVNLALTVFGPWKNVMGFVSKVEYLPYKTSLQNITLSTSQDSDVKKRKWTAAFSVSLIKMK